MPNNCPFCLIGDYSALGRCSHCDSTHAQRETLIQRNTLIEKAMSAVEIARKYMPAPDDPEEREIFEEAAKLLITGERASNYNVSDKDLRQLIGVRLGYKVVCTHRIGGKPFAFRLIDPQGSPVGEWDKTTEDVAWEDSPDWSHNSDPCFKLPVVAGSNWEISFFPGGFLYVKLHHPNKKDVKADHYSGNLSRAMSQVWLMYTDLYPEILHKEEKQS